MNIEDHKDSQLSTPNDIIRFSLLDESNEDESGDKEDEIAMDFESVDTSNEDWDMYIFLLKNFI